MTLFDTSTMEGFFFLSTVSSLPLLTMPLSTNYYLLYTLHLDMGKELKNNFWRQMESIETTTRQLGQVNLAFSLSANRTTIVAPTFVDNADLEEMNRVLDMIDQSLLALNDKLAAEEAGLLKVKEVLDLVPASLPVQPTPAKAPRYPSQQQQQPPAPQPQPNVAPQARSLDIEPLSQFEFDEVPKYLKGRLTLDRLTQWTDGLSRVFAEKYAIVRQNPARMSHEHRTKYYEWRDQDCDECRGQPFVTEADMKTLCQGKGPKLDPTGRSIVAILRHCGRLREVRSTGILRFVLN